MRTMASVDGDTNLDVNLKKLERDINSTFCKATGKTPFEALYGFLSRFEDAKIRELTEHCETYSLPSDICRDIGDVK